MNLYAFIILSVLSLGFCEECRLNSRTPEMETERKLKEKLTKCYSEILKPPINKDSNSVVVKIAYLLQSFNFDSEEEILTLYSWNYFDWQDDRLTWKPEDYKDIKWIQVSSFDIWSPGLKLINTADADDFDFFYTKCRVNSTGYIRCVIRTEHKVFCASDLTNWPYDTKSCTLQFDQWRPQETKVLFSLSHINFVMEAYQNAGWMIARDKVFKNLNTGIQSAVKFHFVRLAEGLEAIIVVPAFVLSVLTVTGLLLDYRGMNRLGILCMTIISHFLFSNVIADNVPKHSANTPVILSFISCSTIITVICFVLSFCFKYLGKKKTQPPTWIISCNDFVLDGYGNYGVLTKWEVTEQYPEMKQNVEWVHFISISNSVCIFVVVITYIYLLSEYIPKKPVFSFVFDIA
ncbi:neuronal acetylcholine receptor subunit beta-3-like [Leguminivora glycinivorella]|uniref:neuronal acetylcholine receptor subunit beta-3-like n=1 Tax=Leguminivora glycinivorella TaxID=1035111 RepID=UPI00200D3105|nr:neuronal acetylcholine receptor subunit beta-3-like [Leguminivora glycinivorella]